VKRVEYLIPRFPLLGFRLTAAVDGRAKIGPTRLPASSREEYGGLRNFRVGELAEIRGCEAHPFVLNASFRELGDEAIRKHSLRELIRLAGAVR
jgi:(S)-2-hydroxyglutarate dehydrogenase